MADQLNRHKVAAWLQRNGFVEQKKVGCGHRYFTHPASGVKVVVPGHGPSDLTKKVAGNVVRAIVEAGFDKAAVRQELR